MREDSSIGNDLYFLEKGNIMRLTKKALKTANLSKSHFVKLIGVHGKTLDRYFAKEKMLPITKKTIEIGAKVLKETELVWPDIHYGFTKTEKAEYKKNKKKSDTLDSRFKKAFDKEMKD